VGASLGIEGGVSPEEHAVRSEVVRGLTSLSRQTVLTKDLHDLWYTLALCPGLLGIENGLHQPRDVTLHEDRIHQTLEPLPRGLDKGSSSVYTCPIDHTHIRSIAYVGAWSH